MDSNTIQTSPSNQLGAPTLCSDTLGKGAPKKYDPKFCEEICLVAAGGGHIPAMMIKIGVKSKDTWYRWQKEYPEFKESVEYAELISQAFYEDLGLKAVQGKIKDFSATTYALLMNNKFGKDYKRNPTSSEINITNNTLNMTPEQVQQKIAQITQKMKSAGQVIEHHVIEQANE